MPIYEYRCDGCGKQFELIQKFSDQPLITHDACGGNVHRLLSAPALQFKGSGWYVNDYAKGSKSGGNSPGKTESSAKSESSSSNSTSSESSGTSQKTTSSPASDTK